VTEQDERTPVTVDNDTPAEVDDDLEGSAEVDADGSDSEQASGEDEVSELKRKNAQLLSERERVARERKELEASRQQLAEERARLSRSATDPAVDATNQQQAAYQRDLRLEDEVMTGSVSPTVEHLQAVARLSRFREFRAAQETSQVRRAAEALTLPEEIRADAQKLADEEGISLKLATRIVKAEKALAEPKPAAEDDDRRKAKEALRLNRDGAPQLVNRAVSAGEARDRIKESDFNARLARLNPNDPEDFEKRKALVRKWNGKVTRD
jgi:hypothetical protein